MEAFDSTLWRMEEEFWTGGEDVYRRRLADDSLLVFHEMVLTKGQAIDSIAQAPRWGSVRFSQQRIVQLTESVAVLNYSVEASRVGDAKPYTALATSVCVSRSRVATKVAR